ncbi:MAG: TonB-dependent receptor family protein [Flavobacteriaceae bacterium]|jgi:outer membrane receptor protein involved in Fe transport|nr:TonB-dependent receptor family protein [Flavobacteriaceae bacterium]
MKEQKFLYVFLMLFSVFTTALAQDKNTNTVTGTIIEGSTNAPLEYASIYAENKNNPQIVSGAMSDDKGHFSFSVPDGTYYIKIDYLGFKTIELNNVMVSGNTNIGTQKIQADTKMLNEVTVIAEKSTVEIKLDKKVYNVGQDMIVKGGTAGDVLDNVPSVTVDSEGTVSLRGNENVKVLIDGKPTGLANNIQEAMRILSAESIEKVEVITNPSARYEAEGGAGIINIVLKKGKAQGVNGSMTATIGDPKNYELNGNFNFRGEKFNFFTTVSYRDGETKGYTINNNQYIDPKTGETTQFIDEYKSNNRNRNGYNTQFGLEWYILPSVTWTNTVSARKNKGTSPNSVDYTYFDSNRDFLYNRNRYEDKNSNRTNIEYTSSIEKKFSNPDHKIIVEATISQDIDTDNALIQDVNHFTALNNFEKNLNKEKSKNGLVRADYVLPIGDSGRFEAGYLGTFKVNDNQFVLDNMVNGSWVQNNKMTNELEYKENVNALYIQYGNKITEKLSYMAGLRWEDSNIHVNQLTNNDFNNKRYNDFFPSAFLNYEFSQSASVSASYSRRIQRPRGFFLNPFSNYTSDINYFQGNPYLDPSKTNAFDLGYMKRWTGFSLNASAYYNKSDDTFQVVRRIIGTTDNGTPITVSSPINLATEQRYGFEFTLNYTPFKWWKLNGNFNFFRSEVKGDYTFIDNNGNSISENFDKNSSSWFTRVTSRITLPYKIDWQVNGMYKGPMNTAQGKVKGNLSANLSLSKDIIKDKATLTFNVSDVFNSRIREMDLTLPQSISHSEMQWRGRQVNLSFTYRFNQKKNDKQRSKGGNGEEMEGAGEMM